MPTPKWLDDDPTLSPPERLYLAYNRGGPPERAGLAWNGQRVPTWAELLERAESGDEGASGVVQK